MPRGLILLLCRRHELRAVSHGHLVIRHGRFLNRHLHALCRGHVLLFHWRFILCGLRPLRRGVLQRRGRHLLRVHCIRVPRGQVRKPARLMRRMLPGNCVHRGWAIRTAALLLEREHAGGERGSGVGRRTGRGGGVQWALWRGG
jgi:hypothetical protein